jgi:ribose-phosphate pyrophosphokinase
MQGMASFNPIKIFSASQSTYLAEKMARHYGRDLGGYNLRKFSDGELSPSFEESLRGCDVYLVQSTFGSADNFMELLLMIDAAKRASAHQITAVIPYFGYARQDRKDKPRVPIAAKLVANLLTAAGAEQIMTLDLHAGAIQGFFDIPVVHLEGTSVFVPYIKSLGLDNLVVASPDVGGAARARNFAKFFNADIILCDKYRKRANEVASMQVIGDVKDANVVFIDDLIDTGGTICKAAELVLSKGAKSVRAICTHPVMSGDAHARIRGSVLDELIVTDTIPLREENEKIKVLSVSELFAKAIGRIRDHESISSLFINPA